MASFSWFRLLPVALLWVAEQVVATKFPATVEVDLTSPRNDTYAPTALFPIVPVLDLATTNFSGSDPTYVYTYITHLNTTDRGTAATYILVWDFSAGSYSERGGALKLGSGFRNNSVTFTIQNRAQQPDLVAAAASVDAPCSSMSHFAFNLIRRLDVALSSQYDGRDTCAVFSDV
ncbi:hypothetical protein GQ53DRAFT_828333 [Thozetella sp. PMI_491]|nr:hypothetical protein GQ53DRAFT_828333 [Thozetella sp. PMI_491]